MKTARLYTLELECPRCKRREQVTVGLTKFNAAINCGNCLVEHAEIVEMKLNSR
jgi:transcription elongation factor Elf1